MLVADRARRCHEVAQSATVARMTRECEERVRAAVDQERRISNPTDAVTVTVYPFVKTKARRGWLSRGTSVDLGYKFQLFVQGVPCLAPCEVVVESTEHKEVDEELVGRLQANAFQIAEAAVHLPAAGGAAKAISIARTVVRAIKHGCRRDRAGESRQAAALSVQGFATTS